MSLSPLRVHRWQSRVVFQAQVEPLRVLECHFMSLSVSYCLSSASNNTWCPLSQLWMICMEYLSARLCWWVHIFTNVSVASFKTDFPRLSRTLRPSLDSLWSGVIPQCYLKSSKALSFLSPPQFFNQCPSLAIDWLAKFQQCVWESSCTC